METANAETISRTFNALVTAGIASLEIVRDDDATFDGDFSDYLQERAAEEGCFGMVFKVGNRVVWQCFGFVGEDWRAATDYQADGMRAAVDYVLGVVAPVVESVRRECRPAVSDSARDGFAICPGCGCPATVVFLNPTDPAPLCATCSLGRGPEWFGDSLRVLAADL